MNNQLINGTFKYCKVYSYGTTYTLSYEVYKAALKVEPAAIEQFKHTIELRMDSVEYKEATRSIITFINHATLCGEVLVPLKFNSDHSLARISSIPEALVIIDWCNTMLKPSASFTSYRDSIVESIKYLVSMCRALVTHDDSKCGGTVKRMELIRATGLPIALPEFLQDIMVLPLAKREGVTSIDTMRRHLKSSLKINFDRCQLISPDRYTTAELTPTNGYDHISMTGADLLALQTKVSAHIYTLQAKVVCHDRPDFMKIKGFGPEAESILRGLIPPPELSLCHPTNAVDICHVFMYGLSAAVNACFDDE